MVRKECRITHRAESGRLSLRQTFPQTPKLDRRFFFFRDPDDLPLEIYARDLVQM